VSLPFIGCRYQIILTRGVAGLFVAVTSGCGSGQSGTNLPISTTSWNGAVASATVTRESATSRPAALTGNVIAGCQMFPESDYWNRDISRVSTDAHSTEMINTALRNGVIGGMSGVNEQEYFAVVPYNQPKATMHQASGHWFAQQWPIGGGFRGPSQAGNDGVLMIVQQAGGGNPCMAWEAGGVGVSGTTWSAYGGGGWPMNVNLTPYPAQCSNSGCGGTGISSDGMPVRILGDVRPDEIIAGKIMHTMEGEFPIGSVCGTNSSSSGQNLYQYPAVNSAQGQRSFPCLPGGAKIRLKASYSEAGLSANAVTVLEGLKHFGISVGDNGCCWGVYWAHPLGTRPGDGSGDGFDSSAVNGALDALRITDFEVISLGPTNGAPYNYQGASP